MQLTFESLAELQDFVQWVQAVRQAAPIEPTKSTLVVKDLPEVSAPAVNPCDMTSTERMAEDMAQTDKPVRKRRTKAVMEVARAAETANPTPADSAPESESSGAESNVEQAAPAAEPQASAPADKGDSAEFIQSRLAERPEVSQVEHLNLARTFIGKHGMEKYNASFPLAGLTPNVMGYSPADCATHAAALDFLSLE